MQAENLRVLIRHMEANVCRTLDMGRYHSCGTPACAIGEAASMRHFQSLGLTNEGREWLNYRGHLGHAQAAAELFGTSDAERSRIFGGQHFNVWMRDNVTVAEWVVEARKVLAENGYSMDDALPDVQADAFMERMKNLKPLDTYTEHFAEVWRELTGIQR